MIISTTILHCICLYILFLIILHPPRSTLFPYNDALPISGITSITIENFKGISQPVKVALRPITLLFGANSAGKSTIIQARSEEHTSELQSLRHLVCRLLLEKKKN